MTTAIQASHIIPLMTVTREALQSWVNHLSGVDSPAALFICAALAERIKHNDFRPINLRDVDTPNSGPVTIAARIFFLQHGYITKWSIDHQDALQNRNGRTELCRQLEVKAISVPAKHLPAMARHGAMNNASVMSINAMTMQEAHDCILNDVTKLSQRTKEQLGMLPTDQARSHVAAATTPAASEELPAEVLTDLHCIQAAVDQSTQQAAQQIHARGRDDQLAVLIRGALASTTGHGTVCLNAALNLLSAS